MPEQDTQESTPRAAARSRKLTVIVIILAILPLLLPFPLYSLPGQWTKVESEQTLLQCGSFDCPAAYYWLCLGWLLVLGPSILVGVMLMLLGFIGRLRARRHPTSPKNLALLRASLICGVVWVVLLGCILLYGLIFLTQPVG